ncbi:pentatricopeptide repeat-containing protein At5g52850, chloroplastic-like [Zingiber officinale]|uniref:Pentatricopeptide repeat-containing protein n=1 Tax=Zingiber officinale TaxID=94328 RepID=A0A8J5IKC7_ZINOF|nr:pentatricopeptide repeat-containing protein At5g52850, chloroplastic-like [Zingiber officinale]KAG6535733.1 hypothetical protein ZIOFF_000756 [Zingiber officinale]
MRLRRCWSKGFFPATSLPPSRTDSVTSPRQRLSQIFRSLPSKSYPPHPLQRVYQPPSRVTEDFCCSLLASCSISRSSRHGLCLHSFIIKLGFRDQLPLSNHLLGFYSKCCGLDSARKLFDELTNRDVVTWTSIIAACTRTQKHQEALELFKCMLVSDPSVVPNEFTFSSAARCAASLRSLDLGVQIHAQVQLHGLAADSVVGSALLDCYAKCGRLEEALTIFSSTEYKDVVSLTAMISALVEAEDWTKAIQLYSLMIESGITPTAFTIAKLLTSCGRFFGLRGGRMLHAHVIRLGVELNLVLKTALVDMYWKCQWPRYAIKVFRQTPDSDVMLWTAMITGYSQAGYYQEAIAMFQEMKKGGAEPNAFTYAAVISTCSSVPSPELGKQIHCQAVKAGLVPDVSVGNSLVDLYAKHSTDRDAPMRAFRAIATPNVVSWTALIAGLARLGAEHLACAALLEMQLAGIEPNSYTLSTMLRSFNSPEALSHARKLHAYIIKTMVNSSDLVTGNALVDFYARCGRVNEAWTVAHRMMPRRDVLTYTSLAKGINQTGHYRRALDLIAPMHEQDVKIDGFILACFLSSVAGLSARQFGEQLHGFSLKSGLLSVVSVSNGLIDVYGKCGGVDEARRVFTTMKEPNVVSWNGLISGLTSNGQFAAALSAFEDMRLVSARPDEVTFLLVLQACSHSGLVDSGVDFFNSMHEHDVVPRREHYVCLVDMLGRAGRLEAAACTIETMPLKPDVSIYKTLLASCRRHRNLVLGECTARKAMEIDQSDPTIYALLAGLYDDAGKVEWGEQTRRMMREIIPKREARI